MGLKMKNRSRGLFKHAISLFMAILKAKSTAVKSKASAVKTRIIIFKLLHDKNALVGAFPRKRNELSFEEEKPNHRDSTVILHDDDDDTVECVEERYDDLRHDVELVRDFGERDGELGLENEVDRAADVFIRKFHREMMIQKKQESFKMYQEMLHRGSLGEE